MKIGGGGFTTGFVFNPNFKDVLYARTDMGGAYKWNAATSAWVQLLDRFTDWNMYGVESVAVDPKSANTAYLALGTYTNGWANTSYVVKTTDGGTTFSVTDVSKQFLFGGNEGGRSMGERLAVDPNLTSTLFVGTRRAGLWTSHDSAATWTHVTSFPITATANNVGLSFVAIDPHSATTGQASKTIYVGIADKAATSNLYESKDGGGTWAVVPNAGGPTGLMPHHAVLRQDGTMILVYADNEGPNGLTTSQVWMLATSTGAWTNISPPIKGPFAGLSVDAQHPDTIMVSTMDLWWPGDTQYRTLDGGKTWKDVGPSSVRNASSTPFLRWGAATDTNLGAGNWEGALAIDPFNSDNVIYGTGATIWGTLNLTAVDSSQKVNWTPRVGGFEQTAVSELASPPAGPVLLSAMGDVGGFVHADITISPQGGMESPYFNNQSSVDFAEAAPSVIVRAGNGGTAIGGAVSRDAGQTWTQFKTAPNGGTGNGRIAVSADGKTIVWSPDATTPGYSVDDGVTWTSSTGITGAATVFADRGNSTQFYAVANNTLYASADSGKTFTQRSTGVSGQLRAVPGLQGNVWMANGNGISQSTNGGATFTNLRTVASASLVGFGKAAAGKTHPAIFIHGTVGTVAGIFRSDDTGATWVRANDDLHQWSSLGNALIGDPRVFGRYYGATNGRGIVCGDLY